MLGEIGFWIARPALDAAYQQHFAEPLRTRKAVADGQEAKAPDHRTGMASRRRPGCHRPAAR
jgi:hypothetical protein